MLCAVRSDALRLNICTKTHFSLFKHEMRQLFYLLSVTLEREKIRLFNDASISTMICVTRLQHCTFICLYLLCLFIFFVYELAGSDWLIISFIALLDSVGCNCHILFTRKIYFSRMQSLPFNVQSS